MRCTQSALDGIDLVLGRDIGDGTGQSLAL